LFLIAREEKAPEGEGEGKGRKDKKHKEGGQPLKFYVATRDINPWGGFCCVKGRGGGRKRDFQEGVGGGNNLFHFNLQTKG